MSLFNHESKGRGTETMARKYSKSGWLVWTLIVSACALPMTKVQLPPGTMASDTTLGYHTEQSRHDIRLGQDPPILVENWVEKAFPTGEFRHAKWQIGRYTFVSDVWFPLGVPKVKGEHCGVQRYQGIKIEGGKYKEFKANGWSYVPMEFFEGEQNALRIKCDLDVLPDIYNIAGY